MIWCVEHKSTGDEKRGCDFAEARAWVVESPCRMVEALLIVKENGWPNKTLDMIMGMTFDQDWTVLIPEGTNPLVWSEKLLDALASVGDSQSAQDEWKEAMRLNYEPKENPYV